MPLQGVRKYYSIYQSQQSKWGELDLGGGGAENPRAPHSHTLCIKHCVIHQIEGVLVSQSTVTPHTHHEYFSVNSQLKMEEV